MRTAQSATLMQVVRYCNYRRLMTSVLAIWLVLLLSTQGLASNSVRIQSKTVLKGETGVKLGVYFSNDNYLCSMDLPFEIRSVRNGAYLRGLFTFAATPTGAIPGSPFEYHQILNYYNAPEDSNSCSGPISHTWANPSDYPNADGSPDAFLWSAISYFDYFPPGDDYYGPSFELSFDVGDVTGSFEIDTMCATNGIHLLYIDQDLNEITPSFTKGVVTVVEGERGDWPDCACSNPDGTTQDVITSPYGPRDWPDWYYHDGNDIRLADNAPIHAVLGGDVKARQEQWDEKGNYLGWYIITESAAIDQSGDPKRIVILYHHMYMPLVQKGAIIQKHQVVGKCQKLPSFGPHVHLETRYDSDHRANPTRFLNKPELRCPVVEPGWRLVNSAGGSTPPYDYLLCTSFSQRSEKYDLTAIHVWVYAPGDSLGRKVVIDFENDRSLIRNNMRYNNGIFRYYLGTPYDVTITLTPQDLNADSASAHKIDIKIDPVNPIPSEAWLGLSFQDVSITPCSTMAVCFGEPSLARTAQPADEYCTAIGNITGYTPGVLVEFFSGEWIDDHVELMWRGASGVQANGVRVYRSVNGAAEELMNSGLLRFSAPSHDTVRYLDYAVAKDDDLAYRLAVQFPSSGSVFAEQTVRLDREPSEPATVPRAFGLEQNYPNPFNAGTNISFALDSTNSQGVTLSVFNILGQQVAMLFSETMAKPGRYSLHWDGRDDSGRRAASGVYFCRLRTATSQATKRMVLVR